MTIQLNDYMFYIGGLRPERGYSYAKKTHAVVEYRSRPRRSPYFSPFSSYGSLCSAARHYMSSDNYRAFADETIGTHEIDCKICAKILRRLLGYHDLSNPDWEI